MVACSHRATGGVDMSEFKHLPGCAHVQNMARPRSMRLIGPTCQCGEYYESLEKRQEWLESDEGKRKIKEITDQIEADTEEQT